MDNTSSYKIELKERIQGLTVQAFRKVQSDLERREVARMIYAWRELKIFDMEVLNAISKTLRSNEAHGRILDEEEEDDDAGQAPPAPAATPVLPGPGPTPVVPPAPYPGMSAAGAARMATGEARSKKVKVATSVSKAATAPVPKAPSEKVLNTINRILSVPVEQPFELLALKSDCKASEIRTAYRKIALLIHPDKNPGSEAKCKEALIKLQQGREQAGTQMDNANRGFDSPTSIVTQCPWHQSHNTKQAESDLQMRASGGTKKNHNFVDMADLGEAKPANKCQYPGCDLPPCKQCPNRCCTRNITHCHMLARRKGGLHCFFHPPPRCFILTLFVSCPFASSLFASRWGPGPTPRDFTNPASEMPKRDSAKGPNSPDKSDHALSGVIDGLSNFRLELVAKQQQLLTKLDMELEKVKLLSCSPLPPTVNSFETPPTLSVGAVGGSASAWGSKQENSSVNTMATLQLPGAVDDPEEENSRTDDVFNSLHSVAEQRKKKTPWIHKQGSRAMVEEEGNQARAFSQLNPEYATNRLRHAALDEFPSEAVFRKDSRWTHIVEHNWFERIGLAMIYLNALWIAIDIDYNKALVIMDAEVGFIVVEIVFGLYFTIELYCRYMAYIKTRYALKDAWFVFDLLLVFIMVTETWLMPLINIVIEGIAGTGAGFGRSASVLRVLKVLRVLRTARIVRVARYMPELMILIKGLLVAARSVFFTLVLLLLITYIFSITFTQLSQDTPLHAELFPMVPTAVLTLVLQCVMPDQEGFFRQVAAESPFMGAMVVVFIMVGSLIIMNMLVARPLRDD
eukprot:symbB.v1.2.002806.t1/scaffold91.1/size338584/11